jgi:hypothetical protein
MATISCENVGERGGGAGEWDTPLISISAARTDPYILVFFFMHEIENLTNTKLDTCSAMFGCNDLVEPKRIVIGNNYATLWSSGQSS